MKRSLDIMSVVGWILAVCVIVGGATISTDAAGKFMFTMSNLGNFFDLTSVIIVVMGCFVGLMISYPLSQFAKLPKHFKIMFMPDQYDPTDYINQLVEFARKARINGLLALEEDLGSIQNPFLKSSMLMVVDSVDPEKVKQQLESRIDNLSERHALDASFYMTGAALAPAFGMMGTMFGLVNMLGKLEDVSTLGPNMAIALLTTFYGSIMANIVFTPMAKKLSVRHEEEHLCNMIICEGVQAIQAGENPKYIQERLTNLLPVYKQKGVRTEEAD